MSKVVAINGSPRGKKGNTAMVLSAFLQGMADAGSSTEVFHTADFRIKPCTCGRMHCWYQEPGVCCIQDDMQSLYPKLREAEVLVLATPVYIPLPGAMQDVINRLCPLVVPRLEMRNGRTRARFREDVAIERIALVATGGWWEKDNMGTVVRIAQELAEDASVTFAGAVLRPHAFAMKAQGELTADRQAVLDATRGAGRELAQQGAMSHDTLEAISRPLISEADLIAMYNSWIQ